MLIQAVFLPQDMPIPLIAATPSRRSGTPNPRIRLHAKTTVSIVSRRKNASGKKNSAPKSPRMVTGSAAVRSLFSSKRLRDAEEQA